jgi:hypothetical protein
VGVASRRAEARGGDTTRACDPCAFDPSRVERVVVVHELPGARYVSARDPSFHVVVVQGLPGARYVRAVSPPVPVVVDQFPPTYVCVRVPSDHVVVIQSPDS